MKRPAVLALAAWVLAGVALLAAAFSHPGEALWSGAIFACERPEGVAALAGIALVVGGLGRRLSAASLLCLLAGLLLGLFADKTSAWAWMTTSAAYGRLHLVGPAACLLAGAVLIAGNRPRPILALPACLAVGAATGLTALFNDPGLGAGTFSLGAAATGVWLAVAVAWAAQILRRPFFPIAERIAGSWLVAIGALLLGAQILARPPEAPLVAPPAPPPALPGPEGAVPLHPPEFAPPRPRGLGEATPY